MSKPDQFLADKFGLDEHQLKIVQYVVAEKTNWPAPLVVYGPFGTGKTRSMAAAAAAILLQEWFNGDSANDDQILICTHSHA